MTEEYKRASLTMVARKGGQKADAEARSEDGDVSGDSFSRQDIVSMLRAVVAANADISTKLSFPEGRAYRAGFAAAIRAVAIGFSINPELEAGLYKLEQEASAVEIDYWKSSPPALPPPSASLRIIGDPEDDDLSPE